MMKESRVSETARAWIAASLDKSGRKQTDLAEALGMAPSAVTRMLKGERQVSLDELGAAMKFFGDTRSVFAPILSEIPIHQIMDGPQQTLTNLQEMATGDRGNVPVKNPIVVPNDGVVEINLNADLPENARLSGEAFWHPIYEPSVVKSIWQIPSHALTSLGITNNGMLRCFIHQGDAMIPILNDGDTVFVDANIKSHSPPGLYAIADPIGGAIIRRLEAVIGADGKDIFVMVSCENPRYTNRTEPEHAVTVLGRLVAVLARPS